MVSYKKMYLETKKELKQLSGWAIDMRDFPMGSKKRLNFEKDKWEYMEESDRLIIKI